MPEKKPSADHEMVPTAPRELGGGPVAKGDYEGGGPGFHGHSIDRGSLQTSVDGRHRHYFLAPSGALLATAFDGAHRHVMATETSGTTEPGGGHDHVAMYEGTAIVTEAQGDAHHHSHEAGVEETARDGGHQHMLVFPDGTTTHTLTAGELWSLEPLPDDDDADNDDPLPQDLPPDPPESPDSITGDAAPYAIPVMGPRNAPVAFVAKAPGNIELARREPFVGLDGRAFKAKYLAPLGLTRDDVVMGYAQDPALIETLKELSPDVVVAFGKDASAALGPMDHIKMPHPVLVRKYDSGEVARKLKRVAVMIGKQAPSDEGDATQAADAQRLWSAEWHTTLPTSGTGRFIYHQHFEGLGEDQQNLGRQDLLDAGATLHGDLRLEGEMGLWGFGVMLGDARDNARLPHRDRLIDGENPPLSLRLPQPKAWLNVGTREPLVSQGEKLFAIDQGTYRLGVARQDTVELFLDGELLKGRYLVQSSRNGSGGGRTWVIQKPADQTPMAERTQRADVMGELRRGGETFLIWPTAGGRPQKVNARTGQVIKTQTVQITKADDEKRIVYGVVLDPYQFDAHGDYISPKEIERTAHEWFQKSRLISLHHRKAAEASPVESWVEQYPTQKDYRKAQRDEPHRAFRRQFGNDTIHSGAWVLGTKLSEELWEAFKAGDIQAYSIEGFGIRTPATQDTMPKVTFVDLQEVKREPRAQGQEIQADPT